MSAAPYLFDEMNEIPPERRGRRRKSPLAPGVRAALAGLRATMKAIPPAEWEVRQERWNELQRQLRNSRLQNESQTTGRRSAALWPQE